VVYGTWAPAQMQGITAGQSAAGLPAVFVPMPRAATLKAVGVEVFSIGQVAPTDAGDRVVEAEIEGNYFCFVCRDQRLVGAILLGKASLASQVKRLVESGSACPVLPTAADWLRFLEVN